MPDYAAYSFWLEDSGEALTPRPPLVRSTDVDVAILGGGYSGLWTAYYLLIHEPALRVAVVDKEIAGFGASGRNGGWCSPNFPLTADGLEKRFGAEAARSLLLAMRASVDEVGRVCSEEKIDARFHKGGVLTLARGQHQLPGIRSAYATYQRLGLADRYQLLSGEEARNAFVSPMCMAESIHLTAQACIRRASCVAWRGRSRHAAESSTSRRR